MIRNRVHVLDRWLLRSAGILLALVGPVKLATALVPAPYLAHADPVISFMSVRAVLVCAATLELLVAACLLLAPGHWYARMGLLALCATFAIYRLGTVLLEVRSPCPCLGRASDWLQLTPRQVDSLALGLLAVLLLVCGISVALQGWNSPPRDPVARRT